MNKNKEYQIYEIIMLGLKLTKNILKEYSYTDEDIEYLHSINRKKGANEKDWKKS